jgi:hypothetical protein
VKSLRMTAVCFTIVGTIGCGRAKPASALAKADGSGLMRRLVSYEMPEYPRGTLAARTTGVAVAGVVIGVDGTIESATVLQAPDSESSASFARALRNWRFKPLVGRDGTVRRISSKVVVYYMIDRGRGAVVFPAAALGHFSVGSG